MQCVRNDIKERRHMDLSGFMIHHRKINLKMKYGKIYHLTWLEGQGYQISDQGRVKNHKGRITEGHHKPNYYVWVSVYPYQYQLHRLMALVFLPNFYNKYVNHKDHDKTNCKLYNLEWVTPSENSRAAIEYYSSIN